MIQLQYLELTKKRFPELQFNDQKDIIKLEKILKAEAKLDPNVKINDIEVLVSFLKTYGNRFIPLLQDRNIAKIVKGDGDSINITPFKDEALDAEAIFEFQQVFNANIQSYLKNSLRNEDWTNIRYVFLNYRFLVSEAIKDDLCETFSLKNQAINHAIVANQYVTFFNENSYAGEVAYFALLNVISEYYFDDDILNINNSIAQRQKTSNGNLKILGKILYAVTFYKSYSTTLSETLANNQDIAYGWINPNTSRGSFQWTTENIIAILVVLALMIAALFIIPGNTGAVVGLTIFIVRIVVALRRK